MSEPTTAPVYRGRFAPSPTGPLHFGSLVAALGSFLQAHANDGTWLVRMEDLDPPREMAGAPDLILRALEAYGLEWDGEVLYQSARHEAYRAALVDLERQGLIYGCDCSRQVLTPHGGRYPGTCRGRPAIRRLGHALRVLTDAEPVRFEDRLQGSFSQSLEQEVGDFILRRRDGLFAYQLAVVVDDAHQAISEVVRGSDLLSSTPRQIHLQRLLELPTPGYAHLPVVVNDAGEKLSKQTHAPPLDLNDPRPALLAALRFLGLGPPSEVREGKVAEILRWAEANWSLERVPRMTSRPLP